MYNTYIINLEQDYIKYNIIKNHLNKININPIRFNAIYGKNIKNYNHYKKYLSNICKTFCPKSVIGCGLSHYLLLEYIYINDNNEFSLILEDDVKPLFKDKNYIQNIINNIPKNTDIILLYCQGLCNKSSNKIFKKTTMFSGSTAAYIIRNKSIPKINKNKLLWHIDLQRINNKNINILIYNNKLFSINKQNSHNMINNYNTNFILKKLNKYIYINNMEFSEVLAYKVINIPIINKELTSLNIIVIFMLLLIIYFSFIKK